MKWNMEIPKLFHRGFRVQTGNKKLHCRKLCLVYRTRCAKCDAVCVFILGLYLWCDVFVRHWNCYLVYVWNSCDCVFKEFVFNE